MIQRIAETTLKDLAAIHPAIILTGPRNSGTTNLARSAFPDKKYLTLDDPDLARIAKEDPVALLEAYPAGFILDETQAAPDFVQTLAAKLDSKTETEPGSYILVATRRLELPSSLPESSGGKIARLRLLPPSAGELARAGLLARDCYEALLRGFYPSVDADPFAWYSAYISRDLVRDVRGAVAIRSMPQFHTFLKMCAARTARNLNSSELALDCGISHNTARTWIGVLESCGIICLLDPYPRSFGKRLVKSPRMHFLDTGLAARFLGISSPEQLLVHPARAALFESFVASEILKKHFSVEQDSNAAGSLHFWRDNTGLRMDLLERPAPGTLDAAGAGSTLTASVPRAYETKSGKTVPLDYLAGIDAWITLSGFPRSSCAVVYAGDSALTLNGVRAIPWNKVAGAVGA
jgi:predicted AAA+ superfamily ATPase